MVEGVKKGASDAIFRQRRPLPEDPGEMEAALKPHMFPSKMLTKLVFKATEYIDRDIFTYEKEETAAMSEAVAMCFYEYNAQFNCWMALTIASLGIFGPRSIMLLDKLIAKRNQKAQPQAVQPEAKAA